MNQPPDGVSPVEGVPARRGHFLLESGYHTDLWFSLDGLFREPAAPGRVCCDRSTIVHRHLPPSRGSPAVGSSRALRAERCSMASGRESSWSRR